MCFIFTGCKKDEKEELKEKVISELEYVETKTLDILNGLNNITFDNYAIVSEQVKLDEKNQKQQSGKEEQNEQSGKEEASQNENNKQEENQNLINKTSMEPETILEKNKNDINWKSIKHEIELLNESWSIIILDLYSLNVNGGTILDFGTKLNNTIIAIKNENKQESLRNLAELYSSIPIFLKEIGTEENLQRIRKTKSLVINAYSLAGDITNSEINTNIQSAIDIYSKVLSDIDYTKDKTFKTNKVYVLLNELANSIDKEDSDLFYIKYKNFMEAINEL